MNRLTTTPRSKLIRRGLVLCLGLLLAATATDMVSVFAGKSQTPPAKPSGRESSPPAGAVGCDSLDGNWAWQLTDESLSGECSIAGLSSIKLGTFSWEHNLTFTYVIWVGQCNGRATNGPCLLLDFYSNGAGVGWITLEPGENQFTGNMSIFAPLSGSINSPIEGTRIP
jgi:hypothetical protein